MQRVAGVVVDPPVVDIDALLAAGRENEARTWFAKAAEVDLEGETDAVDRLLELDGVVLDELDEDDNPGAVGTVDGEPEAGEGTPVS